MPPSTHFSFILLSLFLLSAACKQKSDGSPVVARYRNAEFTLNQLRAELPTGLSAEDSAALAKSIIEKWGEAEAIADEIFKTNPEIEKKIDQMARQYRLSLMVHAYDELLLENHLNKQIPADTLLQRYEAEKGNYLAKKNLYCFFYISCPEEGSSEYVDLMKSETQQDLLVLSNLAKQKAISFKLDSIFVDEDELEKYRKGYVGSLEKAEIKQLVRWNGVIQGQRRKYFFRMIEVVEKGEPLPLRLVEEDLRQMVLNERKMTLIKENHKKITENARSNAWLQTEIYQP